AVKANATNRPEPRTQRSGVSGAPAAYSAPLRARLRRRPRSVGLPSPGPVGEVFHTGAHHARLFSLREDEAGDELGRRGGAEDEQGGLAEAVGLDGVAQVVVQRVAVGVAPVPAQADLAPVHAAEAVLADVLGHEPGEPEAHRAGNGSPVPATHD